MKRMTLSMFVVFTATTICAAEPARQYAGMQSRAIKALSDEQVSSYLAGEGMGLATAAELNGYPGPKHVLELAAELGLDPEQRAAVEEVRARMKAEAQRLGARVVEAERELDALFAGGVADEATLESHLGRIAELSAALRYAHLRAHIETAALLSDEQKTRYARARGYHDESSDAHRGHH